MRDKRNVLIVMLSVLVLGLATRGRPAPEIVFHKDSISPVVERSTNFGQEGPSLAKEVPSIAKEVPDIAKEVPGIAKEVPNLAEAQSLAKEVPNLAEEVQSIDHQAVIAGSDLVPEIPPKIVEPIESTPAEVPPPALEYKVEEQPPPSVSKEAVFIPPDPCQECKLKLALQEAAPAKPDSSSPKRSGDEEARPETRYQAGAARDTAP
jgi:hypothetical protein